MAELLPPTSARLLDPTSVPYFLWDLGLTVAQVHETLTSSDARGRDELIVRILREANSPPGWHGRGPRTEGPSPDSQPLPW